MRIEVLEDGTSVTATTQSSAVELHMPKTIRGLIQYQTADWSGLTTIVFKLQGRMSSDMDWVDVADTSKTHTSDTATAVEDISLYPSMRCYMTVTGTGSATVDVKLGA
jgi:hypothetical protein